MTEAAINTGADLALTPNKLLSHSAKFWFFTAIIGQWIFVAYIIAFYGGASLSGNFSEWNQVLPHGYIEGDAIGNLAVGIHLAFAVVIMLSGTLQFIPQIRAKLPKLHRISGRLYVITAFILSLGGIYMVLTRGVIGDNSVAITINAVFIIVCAIMSIWFAIRKDFSKHQRWVVRLFLVVSGVWFFRVGLMLWLMIHQAPVGFDPETFTGPFLTFLSYGQYVIPLLFAQLYFWSKNSKSSHVKVSTSITLMILTFAMMAGIFAATMGMWLPRI